MRRRVALTLLVVAFAAQGCSPAAPDGAVILYRDGDGAEIVLGNDDGITAPDGLLWREGTLFIADEGGSAIRAWDGEQVTTLADQTDGLISPEDLRFDESGTLWFTDDSAGGAWRIIAGGAERVDRGRIEESEGIARHPSGGIAIGDGLSGTIYHVGDGGSAVPVESDRLQIAKPESMALAKDGSLFIADNREDRLIHLRPDGSATQIQIPADLSPETIALDKGILWITDSHNGRVYRLEPGGMVETVALFTGDLSNVSGIAIGPDGAIFVSIQADLGKGRGYIVRLSPVSGDR